jgi:2-polyprenyl-3-methyl-5-hydroxy-6-metoxy-1,4-benzoquinol methylase
MPDSPQICDYRQCIYDQYLSKEVRPGGQPSSAKEYQRWADATEARLRGWLPADRHTPVLDLGCGPGNFLYLMDKLGYTNLTGVDLSGEQIEMARQWCPRATLIQGDVKQNLAETPNKYGLITGFDIIEHFTKSEIMPFIKQIARALSTGGRLILQTPNAESPWGLMYRYGDFTHEIAFTPRSLEHVLRMNGFTGFAARECGPHAHGVKSLIRLLVWRFIRLGLRIWNLAETGGPGSGIYTRAFILTAIRD